MKTNNILAFFLLAIVSLGHLFRIIFSIDVTIAATSIPMYISIIAFLLFGFAAYSICEWKKSTN